MKISDLNDMISSVCPIDGINSDGVIWFKPSATASQRAAATELMHINLPNIIGDNKERRVSSNEFIDFFPESEQLAVVAATMDKPSVKLWWDKLIAADYIDLEDVRVTNGLDELTSAGLIAPERKSQVLGMRG